jgi:hypothetical protein
MANQQTIGAHTMRPARVQRTGSAMIRLADRLAIAAIWSLLLAGVVRETMGHTQLLSLGFYTLHIVDIPVVLTFLAWALYQTQRPPSGGFVIVPVLVIAALLLINFARGMMVDPAQALLWARGSLEIAGLLLLAITCSLTRPIFNAFRRALVVSAGLLMILVVLRYIFGVALFMTIEAGEVGFNDGNRPVSAVGAYLIGLAIALLVSDVVRDGINRAYMKAGLASLLLAAEVSTGQATGAIATILMVSAVLMLERSSLRKMRMLLAVAGVVALAVALAAGLLDVSGAESGNWDLTKRSNTFQARQNIWEALMQVFPTLPVGTQLFGLPGGQIPFIVVTMWKDPRIWTFSIHSMYYGSLPMMGYLGLVALTLLLLTLTFGTLRMVLRRVSPADSPAYPFAFCIGAALLSVTYELRNEQLIGLFVAIWWLRYDAQERRGARLSRADSASAPSKPVGQRAGD